MIFFKNILKLREYNSKIHDEKKTEMGWFMNPHILLVGLNPRLTKNGVTDHELISRYSKDLYISHEQAYRRIVIDWMENTKNPLLELIDVKSKWVSYMNLVKEPTVSEGEITTEQYAYWKEVSSKQISLLDPNLVIIFSKKAAAVLLGENIEEGQFKRANGITYILLYHYAYFTRQGGPKEAKKYYAAAREKIDSWLRLNAIIKVTDKAVYYKDIDGKKKSYENPEKNNNTYFIKDPNGQWISVYGDRLSQGDSKVSPFSLEAFDGGLSPTKRFLTTKDVNFAKYLSIFAFDIETNFCNTPADPVKEVLMVSCQSTELDKRINLVLRHPSWLDRSKVENGFNRIFDEERSMLLAFWKILAELQPDIATGWWSNKFDVPYLANRTMKIGLDPNAIGKIDDIVEGFVLRANRDGWDIYSEKTYFIDALEEFKASNSAKGYSLNSVSKELFNDEKMDVAPSEMPGLWEKDPQHLIAYCEKDVVLLVRIIAHADIFDKIRTLQGFAKVNAEDTHHNSVMIEYLIRRKYKNMKFPMKKKNRTSKAVSGILVLDTIPGRYKNVVVFDFSGMYSSLITTFNLSPEKLTTDVFGVTDAGKYKFKVDTEGVLPAIERDVMKERAKYEYIRDHTEEGTDERKKAERRRDNLKTLGNSIYGVETYPGFFLYSYETGQAIVDLEGMMLMYVKDHLLKKFGLRVLYGDTDSLFVELSQEIEEQGLLSEAKRIVDDLNQALIRFALIHTTKEQVEKYYSISLGIDKLYSRFYITDKKKRYFGWLVGKKGKSVEKRLDVTGFDTRRHDLPEKFNQPLLKIYGFVLEDDMQGYAEFVKQFVSEIHHASISEMIIHLKLGRNVGEFDEDGNLGPGDFKNKAISWQAVKNGGVKLFRGDVIDMIFTKDGPLHYTGQTVEVNYDMYIEKFLLAKVRLVNKELLEYTKEVLGIEKKHTRKRKEKTEDKTTLKEWFEEPSEQE